MATTIKLKNSVTTTNTPSSLAQGEVAINITDKKVWVGNAATTPIQLLGDGASASFGALSCASLTNSGNLTLTGTGNRITGDFSNATLANRVALQTSTTNGSTSVEVIPNGTAVNSSLILNSDSAVTNSSRLILSALGGSEIRINSAISGTGTYLPLTMYTGGSERLRIDTSGNVGIGTTTAQSSLDVGVGNTSAPTYKGHVRLNGGGLAANGGLEFMNTTFGSGYGWRLQTPDEGGGSTPIVFQTRSNSASWTERMRITVDGNVGIGTSSPNALLNIQKSDVSGFTANTSYDHLVIENGTSGTGTVVQIVAATNGVSEVGFSDSTRNMGLVGYSHSTDAMYFHTNGNNERMRITSGGDLLVNTTTAREKITVNGKVQASTFYGGLIVTCAVVNTWYKVQDGYFGLYVFRDSTSGGNAALLYDGTTGATIFSSSIGTFEARNNGGNLEVRVTSNAPRTLYWACLSTVSG